MSTQQYNEGTDTYEKLPAPYAKGEHTNIVVVGKVGTGKSSICNMMLEKEGVFPSGFSPSGVTKEVASGRAYVGGRSLQLIDTPGLLEAVASEKWKALKKLGGCISLLKGKEGIDAFLFVIRCDQKPSQEEMTAVIQLTTLFSGVIFEYMIIVATHLDKLQDPHLKESLPHKMKTILWKAGNRMVFVNSSTQDGETRRGYIKSIISQVDAIARAHEGKKFTHKAIEQASKIRKELSANYPYLSEYAIQNKFETKVQRHVMAQYSCFDGSSTVRLSDGSVSPMDKLSPGDKVLCLKINGSVGFEEIFCFSHADEKCQTIYFHLETATGQRLLLSYGHYIHARSNSTSHPISLKAAHNIQVGDVVFVYDPATKAMFMDEIVSTGTKYVTGAFCPHTMSGTIIVNDILASSYTDAVDPLVARKLLMPALFLYKFLPLRMSAPMLKDGVSNTCKILSATKQYLKSLY